MVRRIGVVGATALVVSNMIGTGIFTTTGFLAGDLGSPLLVISIWLVGGAIALAGALCYMELALNFPRSGGEYVYLTEAWGPAWGFIDGWVSFFAGFAAPIAAAALAISAYLGLADSGNNVSLGFLTLHLGGCPTIGLRRRCRLYAVQRARRTYGGPLTDDSDRSQTFGYRRVPGAWSYDRTG